MINLEDIYERCACVMYHAEQEPNAYTAAQIAACDSMLAVIDTTRLRQAELADSITAAWKVMMEAFPDHAEFREIDEQLTSAAHTSAHTSITEDEKLSASVNLQEEIQMLTQPLTTEEGFLNPACMAELEGAIADMPRPHDRLRGDPEWDDARGQWTTPKDIVGAFAMWACRQSPYGVPDGLENVCKYLYACLKRIVEWPTAGMRECSLCEINKWLYEILYDQGVAEFDAWNRCKVGDTPNFMVTSRYDGTPDPDRDFIDLDALLRNVCIQLRNERRNNARPHR